MRRRDFLGLLGAGAAALPMHPARAEQPNARRIGFLSGIAEIDVQARQFVEAFREGANSVKEVSYVLGFESPSHFTSLFRKVTGLSPSEARAGVPFAGVARKWFGGLFAQF